MAKLALLLLPLAVVAQIENPCQGMTVADCRIGEDNIVDQLPFDAADCERSCEMSDNCYFWRFYQDNSMPLEPPQCLHLGTNYHKVKRVGIGKNSTCFRTVPALPDQLRVTLSLA